MSAGGRSSPRVTLRGLFARASVLAAACLAPSIAAPEAASAHGSRVAS